MFTICYSNTKSRCISNGTIFRTDVQGVVPGLLENGIKKDRVTSKQKKATGLKR